MTPPAIIFDLDGTLVEPEHDFFVDECDRLFPHIVGKNMSKLEIERAIKCGTIFEHFPVENRDELVANFWSDYRNEEYPHPKLFPYTNDILKQIQNAGLEMVIATARVDTPQKVAELLKPLGILNYFKAICTGQVYGTKIKNKVPIIQDAIQALNKTPQECIMIGDSATDIKSAKICGCKLSIAVRSGGFDSEYLESLQADHLISSVAELPGLLKSLSFTSV